MRVMQYEFERGESVEKTHLVCWVDVSYDLKVGSRVSFHGDERVWTVKRIYKGVILDVGDINRTWKVGGL